MTSLCKCNRKIVEWVPKGDVYGSFYVCEGCYGLSTTCTCKPWRSMVVNTGAKLASELTWRDNPAVTYLEERFEKEYPIMRKLACERL